MKRMIASSVASDQAIKDARKVLSAAKALLDALDETHGSFIADNDLDDLYQTLIDEIPALDLAIKTNTVESGKLSRTVFPDEM